LAALQKVYNILKSIKNGSLESDIFPREMFTLPILGLILKPHLEAFFQNTQKSVEAPQWLNNPPQPKSLQYTHNCQHRLNPHILNTGAQDQRQDILDWPFRQ
jgi:hypothetical protein